MNKDNYHEQGNIIIILLLLPLGHISNSHTPPDQRDPVSTVGGPTEVRFLRFVVRRCWKYALEAIIKVSLLYFFVHDNCLHSCYNCIIRKS